MPITKKEGGIRIVIDYKKLNAITKEPFSMPFIEDILSDLSRLAAANLTVKVSKCCWCFKSFDFLGHHEVMASLQFHKIKFHKLLITSYQLTKHLSSHF